jgi:hypothetical protein
MVFGDGRPFLGNVATATSTGIDKTSPQDSPGVPASSYPIKGQARALQGETDEQKSEAKHKQAKAEDQHLTACSFRWFIVLKALFAGLL